MAGTGVARMIFAQQTGAEIPSAQKLVCFMHNPKVCGEDVGYVGAPLPRCPANTAAINLLLVSSTPPQLMPEVIPLSFFLLQTGIRC